MFDWLKLALAALKLANILADWGREHSQIQAGVDAELGRQAEALLRATDYGKKLLAKVDSLDKPSLDDLTDALGR